MDVVRDRSDAVSGPAPDRALDEAEQFGADVQADGELVLLARHGDDAALASLLTKYRVFARVKARSYFLVGADREDTVQEGMIGLYKAIRDFNPDMQCSFRAFAELCVTRQIITAIKTATRHKHGPLNNYVSFSRPVHGEDDRERVLADVLPSTSVSDPADLVVGRTRPRPAGARRRRIVRPRDRGAAPVRRGQELPGDRRTPAAPRQIHRQRAAAHQAQA